MKKENKVKDGTAVNDDDRWVGEGGKHEGKDSCMGFSMIYISGGGANGVGQDMGHEMMRPRGSCGP